MTSLRQTLTIKDIINKRNSELNKVRQIRREKLIEQKRREVME